MTNDFKKYGKLGITSTIIILSLITSITLYQTAMCEAVGQGSTPA